ncbi:hypothetical protein [Arthrobacter sp. R-11]|uniref:hypothetical protein n=1 Tax=Arthrobacter sp. R-11 TaxID=3404053 RepID=UPI003CE7B380
MRAMAARLALFLAVAAVLAGFLGMHVLNGHHAGHMSSAVAVDTAAHSVAMKSAHVTDAHGCGCSSPSPEVSEAHPSCDPMTSTVTLLPQGGSPFVLRPVPPVMQLNASGSVLLDSRSHSLHELCISRC